LGEKNTMHLQSVKRLPLLTSLLKDNIPKTLARNTLHIKKPPKRFRKNTGLPERQGSLAVLVDV
jgi:hypothetical protein